MHLQMLCVGVFIASAVALSSINGLQTFNDDSEAREDSDRYRAVAAWLLFVGITGTIIQVAMVIIRALFYGEIIISQFRIFGVIVSLIYMYMRMYVLWSVTIKQLFTV